MAAAPWADTMAADNGKLILALLLVAAVVNAAAYLFSLWDSFFWFDKAIHFYTSFAITLALAFVWRERLSRPLARYPLTLVLAVAALGLALGVVWEVAEWMADQLSGRDTIQGKTDTIFDLILDGFGAVFAGLLAIPRGRNSPKQTRSSRPRPRNGKMPAKTARRRPWTASTHARS